MVPIVRAGGGLSFLGSPPPESDDGIAQGEAALGERVRARVVPEGQTVQDPRRFELAQARGEHIRPCSEVALQIPVALGTVEQSLHDEQGPPWSDDVEGRGEVAHAVGSASGFIQNGE